MLRNVKADVEFTGYQNFGSLTDQPSSLSQVHQTPRAIMARFTSIGMGKKTFVASAAEDRQSGGKQDVGRPESAAEAGPSTSQSKPKSKPRRGKKRTRDGKDKAKIEGEGGDMPSASVKEDDRTAEPKVQGWGRDKDAASQCLLRTYEHPGYD
jgi:hypothetical protein